MASSGSIERIIFNMGITGSTIDKKPITCSGSTIEIKKKLTNKELFAELIKLRNEVRGLKSYNEILKKENAQISERKNVKIKNIDCENIIKTPIQHEPLQTHRWQIETDSLELQPWTLKSISPISFINGKWNDIELTMIDYISTANIIYGMFDTIKDKWHSKKYTFKLNMLDPTGVPIREYQITTNKLDFVLIDGLDYSGGELVNTKLILKSPKVTVIY